MYSFLFFYLPAGIVLPLNIVLFVLILKRIQYIQHESKRMEEGTLHGADSKIQAFLIKKRKKFVQLLFMRKQNELNFSRFTTYSEILFFQIHEFQMFDLFEIIFHHRNILDRRIIYAVCRQ